LAAVALHSSFIAGHVSSGTDGLDNSSRQHDGRGREKGEEWNERRRPAEPSIVEVQLVLYARSTSMQVIQYPHSELATPGLSSLQSAPRPALSLCPPEAGFQPASAKQYSSLQREAWLLPDPSSFRMCCIAHFGGSAPETRPLHGRICTSALGVLGWRRAAFSRREIVRTWCLHLSYSSTVLWRYSSIASGRVFSLPPC
jgi:hypothetical protein